MLDKLLNIRLSIFDGGAAAEGAEGASAPTPAKKSGEFDNVVFGKQSEPAEETVAETTNPNEQPRDLDAEFEAMINGEYKDIFKKNVESKMNARFGKMKETQEKLGQAERVLRVVADRYGERNIDKLEELVTNDARLLEDEALEKNMSVEQLLEVKKLKAQFDNERAVRMKLENDRKAEDQYSQWLNESQGLKEKFPDFNLETEVKNKDFVDMLERGISIEHAYKVLHYDELMQNNVANAIEQGANAAAQTIAARGNRPKENGSNKNSAIIYKSDVSKLNAKEREEIAKRVARGETITF